MPRPYFVTSTRKKTLPAWQLLAIVFLVAFSLLFLFSGCDEARAQGSTDAPGGAPPSAPIGKTGEISAQRSAQVALDIPALVPGRPVAGRKALQRATQRLRRLRERGAKPILVLRIESSGRFPMGRAPSTTEERVLRAFLPELLALARRAGASGVCLPSERLRREARRLVADAGFHLMIGERALHRLPKVGNQRRAPARFAFTRSRTPPGGR